MADRTSELLQLANEIECRFVPKFRGMNIDTARDWVSRFRSIAARVVDRATLTDAPEPPTISTATHDEDIEHGIDPYPGPEPQSFREFIDQLDGGPGPELPRCVHGHKLRDWSDEKLFPPCGCTD
jgi:hypothetical protein